MKLLLEGSLSETLTLKDLLAGILQAEAPGLSVLQLAISGADYGEVFFLGGHFVVAARLHESDVVADEAFNHLLQLKEADFHYHTCDSLDALPSGKPLKIDLKDLIENWQSAVPVSSNDLLDKIFNKIESRPKVDVTTAPEQSEEEVKEEERRQELPTPSPFLQDRQGFGGKQADVDWDLVNPLLITGAPGENAMSIIGSAWDEKHVSTQELRSLSMGAEGKRTLRDSFLAIIIIAIITVILLCLAWLALNSPSMQLSPRRFSVPSSGHSLRRTQTFNHFK